MGRELEELLAWSVLRMIAAIAAHGRLPGDF
jgi:hypothetical protein